MICHSLLHSYSYQVEAQEGKGFTYTAMSLLDLELKIRGDKIHNFIKHISKQNGENKFNVSPIVRQPGENSRNIYKENVLH